MKHIRRDERGVASIIIVTVIISVVALIVLGFASLMRREQRQALDQQLSTQARFAAESAINEKIAQFRSNPSAFTTNTTCSDQGQTFQAAATDEIQTTCVKVTVSPGPLEFDEVSATDSTIVWLDPGTSLVPLDRIVVTWQNTRGGPDGSCWTTGYNQFPQTLAASDRMGLLRFDISRVGTAGATFTRDSLKTNSMGGVLFPMGSGGAVSTLPWTTDVSQQPRVFGSCDNDPATPAGVAGSYKGFAIIDLPNANERYVLRLRSLYRSNLVKVVGFDTGGQVVEFQGAQVAIEATARVGDIVQRVQVRVPTGNPPTNILPDEALHTGGTGVCKFIETEPSNTTDGC